MTPENKETNPKLSYDQLIKDVIGSVKFYKNIKPVESKINKKLNRAALQQLESKDVKIGDTISGFENSDISIQDNDGNNIFLGECKRWYEEKDLTATINQVIDKYIIDKAGRNAIIISNYNNTKISQLVETAKRAVQLHPYFLNNIDGKSEIISTYEFRNDNDPNKPIQIELLILNHKV